LCFTAQALCDGRIIYSSDWAFAGDKTPSSVEEGKSRVSSNVEAKAGYFIFSDATMRKIYDKGGLDAQFSASATAWKWLQIYGSIEYLYRSGRSKNKGESTFIWELPVSLGLKPVVKISSCAEFYFSIGPQYFYVHQHNRSSFVPKNVHDSGVGGFVNAGFNFLLRQHLLLDVFGGYAYRKAHFHSSENNVNGERRQVGGFTFGAGLGYYF
jgi:hypothetical protein